jgi:hypothetical protein
MASTHNLGGNYWGSLINPDKSAAPLLIQLCEGLAKIIVSALPFRTHLDSSTDLFQLQLESEPDLGLTPQRLATFYRSVGGSDFVFRELGNPGLSLLYKTLGCFHSLQPSANAFESPSLPCLLVPGFVRWQTQQLLLNPDEHAEYLTKAVERYDVLKPDGSIFPKTIPREAFPSKPDEEMEKWHRKVVERLDEGHPKLKNSPYISPFEQSDPTEGYFPRSSPHARKTSRPARTHSQDMDYRGSSSGRRRSSVPNNPSPMHPPEPLENHHWSSDHAFPSAPTSTIQRSPSHRHYGPSASLRPLSQPYGRTSNSYTMNTSSTTTNNTTTTHRPFHLSFEKFHLPFISSSSKKNRDRESTSAAKRYNSRRSPTRSVIISSGSEASSEDSGPAPSTVERQGRRRSLAPPNESNRYQRRHSHDASYSSHRAHSQKVSLPPLYNRQGFPYKSDASYVPSTAPLASRFRNDLFGDYDGQGTSSAPESPLSAPGNPSVRVTGPAGRDRHGERGRERCERWHGGEGPVPDGLGPHRERRNSSGVPAGRRGANFNDPSAESTLNSRREGMPLRVKTVTGTGGGRRARAPEVRSAGLPNLRRVSTMNNSGGGGRR